MGMAHVIPQILKKIHTNQKVIDVFSANHSRSFCFINDAIKQIINLSHNPKIKNTVKNIGNNSGEIKIKELVSILIKISNKKKKLKLKFLSDENYNSPKRRVPYIDKKYHKNIKFTSLFNGCTATYKWYLKNVFND